ncbi:hypothetical protein GQ600_6452 [Phytophthora cactorum]|nr:hypothetical protein GQ600_6452 [Phytophthora cactorum]
MTRGPVMCAQAMSLFWTTSEVRLRRQEEPRHGMIHALLTCLRKLKQINSILQHQMRVRQQLPQQPTTALPVVPAQEPLLIRLYAGQAVDVTFPLLRLLNPQPFNKQLLNRNLRSGPQTNQSFTVWTIPLKSWCVFVLPVLGFAQLLYAQRYRFLAIIAPERSSMEYLHGGKTSNPTKHLSETHQIYSAKTILQTARKRGREEEMNRILASALCREDTKRLSLLLETIRIIFNNLPFVLECTRNR